jgi:hypothetical protein
VREDTPETYRNQRSKRRVANLNMQYPLLLRAFSGAFSRIMRSAGDNGYRLHDARHARIV